MSNNNWIQAMLTNLELQKVFNYSITIKKYGVVYIILMRWFIKKFFLNFEANMEY